jgi:integrase
MTENEIRYVTIEEYRKLMKAAGKIWWNTLFPVAYGSGLRRSEILHLTWADIDFEGQRIKIVAKKGSEDIIEWEPKSRKNRVVPISDEAADLMVNMQAEAFEGYLYVFVSPKRLDKIKERRKIGNWIPRSELINNLGRDFNVVRRRANVAECTINDLRRSAITNWAEKLPIQVVQQLAGYASVTTTRKYYLAVGSEDIQSSDKWVNKILARTYPD